MVSKGGVPKGRIIPVYLTDEGDVYPMGNWTRANAELCLLGVRGKPKRMDAGVHSVIMSHIEEHSKKPAETRDRIVKLMAGGGGYLK